MAKGWHWIGARPPQFIHPLAGLGLKSGLQGCLAGPLADFALRDAGRFFGADIARLSVAFEAYGEWRALWILNILMRPLWMASKPALCQ